MSVDVPDGWNAGFCEAGASAGHVPGHVNWQAVTYEGSIDWVSHSSPGTDDDYNFNLRPPTLATLVPADPAQIGVEFDSDETIDHFHTPWWNSFHDAVDDGRGNRINGADGVIVGLLGLDCEHSCGVELHPVYAMAIHDPSANSAADDVWALFARNWGNEGYCSSRNHQLPLNTVKVRIPWRSGSTGVTVSSQRFLSNANVSMSIDYAPGEGVLVTFNLPPPGDEARVNGELHLSWSGNAAAAPAHGHAVFISAAAAAATQGEAESALQALVGTMTPAQRQVFESKLQKVRVPDSVGVVVPAARRMEHLPLANEVPSQAVSVASSRKAEKDKLRKDAMCAAFGNKVPGRPNACQ